MLWEGVLVLGVGEWGCCPFDFYCHKQPTTSRLHSQHSSFKYGELTLF